MSYDSQNSAEYLKENGQDGAMTDAGEKLRTHSLYLRAQHFAQCRGFAFTSGAVKLAYDFAIAELERAAEIAEQVGCDRHGCSEKVADAIRRRKE